MNREELIANLVELVAECGRDEAYAIRRTLGFDEYGATLSERPALTAALRAALS